MANYSLNDAIVYLAEVMTSIIWISNTSIPAHVCIELNMFFVFQDFLFVNLIHYLD